MKTYIKYEMSEFDAEEMASLDYIGDMDSMMPLADLKKQMTVSGNGWIGIWGRIAEGVKESGYECMYIVIDEEEGKVHLYAKNDIAKLLEK